MKAVVASVLITLASLGCAHVQPGVQPASDQLIAVRFLQGDQYEAYVCTRSAAPELQLGYRMLCLEARDATVQSMARIPIEDLAALLEDVAELRGQLELAAPKAAR